MSHQREQLERTADRIRDELLVTLAELERRRERATDVRHQIARHGGALALLAVAATASAAAATGYAAYRIRHRDRYRMRRRAEAVQRAWQRPERVAAVRPKPTLAAAFVRRLALTFGTVIGVQLARRTSRLLPAGREIAAPGARPRRVLIAAR